MHQAQTQIITNNFNPRSPHGERPVLVVSHRGGLNFNPRSPHGERLCQHQIPIQRANFNPRSPHGERRAWCLRRVRDAVGISIHAPRTGSDRFHLHALLSYVYFNPRSPHGERQNRYQVGDIIQIFQSTLPARGATTFAGLMTGVFSFQSTLPARGATVSL